MYMCVCISHIYCAPVNLSLFPFSLHKSFFFFFRIYYTAPPPQQQQQHAPARPRDRPGQAAQNLYYTSLPFLLLWVFPSPPLYLSLSLCTALEVIASLIRARFMLHWINLHIVQKQKKWGKCVGKSKWDYAAGGVIQMKSTYKVFKFNFPFCWKIESI